MLNKLKDMKEYLEEPAFVTKGTICLIWLSFALVWLALSIK